MDFYHSQESIKKKLDKGLDASKNVLHKAREFIGNKIADAITKLTMVILKNKNLLKK